jgi:triosephosphate isomerase (TIM)
MKKLFIIANWKSYKTTQEANDWLQAFAGANPQEDESKEVIICAPFTLLSLLKSYTDEVVLPIKIGSQDVSPFEEGAETGEVAADQVKEFADYAIIGHSERRKNFNETDDILKKKVELALKYHVTPIFCVQDENTFIPEGVELVAYEPIFAIGSGTPDTPENAENVIHAIKEKNQHVKYVLYGGSVKPENVHSFTASPSIDGVLVGGASLDAHKFFQMIQNA